MNIASHTTSTLTVRKLSKTSQPPRETPRNGSIGGIVLARIWGCYFGSLAHSFVVKGGGGASNCRTSTEAN